MSTVIQAGSWTGGGDPCCQPEERGGRGWKSSNRIRWDGDLARLKGVRPAPLGRVPPELGSTHRAGTHRRSTAPPLPGTPPPPEGSFSSAPCGVWNQPRRVKANVLAEPFTPPPSFPVCTPTRKTYRNDILSVLVKWMRKSGFCLCWRCHFFPCHLG